MTTRLRLWRASAAATTRERPRRHTHFANIASLGRERAPVVTCIGSRRRVCRRFEVVTTVGRATVDDSESSHRRRGRKQGGGGNRRQGGSGLTERGGSRDIGQHWQVVVVESPEAAIVWKSSGVDTHRSDYSRTTDRAGPPVLHAARRAWGDGAVVCSDLEKSAAGLVVVAKTPTACAAIDRAAADISAKFTVVALKGNDITKMELACSSSKGCSSAWKVTDTLVKERDFYTIGRPGTVEVLGASASEMRQTLKIVTRWSICARLDNRGAHVALIELSNLPEELMLGTDCVVHAAPKKFAKLLRRTELQTQRREQLAAEAGDGAKMREVQFCGVQFLATSEQLAPRKSSEILVKAALSTLNSRSSVEIPTSVLDLGTGSGCLLLSILLATPSAISGIGCDLSDDALSVAALNADMLQRKHPLLHGRALFMKADFGKLHAQSGGTAVLSSRAPFRVIVSNPPYLAADRSKSRETRESKSALYAGETGMEAYVAIMRSLSACDPPLLARDGVLILQAPGGERGHIRVAAVAEQEGWEVSAILKDERGVGRAIECRLRP